MRTHVRAEMNHSTHRLQACCRHCREWFSYEVKVVKRRLRDGQTGPIRVTRCVCDACQSSRRRWTRTQARPIIDHHALPGEFTSREEIAEIMGLTAQQVREIERVALDKLRNSPDLWEAYEQYKEDGLPLVERIRKHIRAAVKAREERLMLQLQMDIMDWWRVHDLALAESALVTAETAYEKARIEVKRATGSVLEEYGISVADAKAGVVEADRQEENHSQAR